MVDKHAQVINTLLKRNDLGGEQSLDWEVVREVVAAEDGIPVEIAPSREAVASAE